jgi:hypothetical protein
MTVDRLSSESHHRTHSIPVPGFVATLAAGLVTFSAFATDRHSGASLLKSPETTKKPTMERDCDYFVLEHFHAPFLNEV